MSLRYFYVSNILYTVLGQLQVDFSDSREFA